MALNLASQNRARRRTERTTLQRLADQRPPAAPDLPGDDFWSIVRQLPARQAAAVTLHYLEDRPVREVAAILGCAEGTAKAHCTRAGPPWPASSRTRRSPMDLDDRATRASEALRCQVEPSLDVARARASVQASVGSRRDNLRRRALVGGTALAVVAIVGVLAVAGGVGEGGARLNSDGGDATGETDRFRSAAILGATPSSPLDGKTSWPLPVLAEPQSGLRDGETVTIYGRGFEANESVGIVQCTSEADTAGAGVDACQLTGNRGLDADVTHVVEAATYATASAAGDVVADFVVRRYLTTPAGGQVDCLTAAERCLVGMGAVSDDDRSGGGYISFDDAPPFPDPVMAVDPAGPYARGQQVRVTLSGMVAGRDLLVQQCIDERCQDFIDAKVDVTGSARAGVAVRPSITDPVTGDEIACQDRCELRVSGIGVKGQSSAPLPDPIELRFTSERPSG